MFPARVRLFSLICFAALIAVWGRVAYLQLALGPWFRATLAEADVRVRSIPAPRGTIRTADGTVLAVDRCDADLAVHYRYLERPLDDAWLASQARARLSRRERRDPERVEQAKEELRGEIEAMWQALADLTDTDRDELDRRAGLVQRRVERVVESVNRHRRQRWARESAARTDSEPPDDRSDEQHVPSEPSRSDSVIRRIFDWVSDTPPPAPTEPGPVTVLEQSRYYALVEGIAPEVLLEFAAHPERFPGVRLEQAVRRSYPQRELACGVIGHVEPVAVGRDGESDAAIPVGSGIGRTGVEGFYELQLRGEPGQVREQIVAVAGPPRVLGGRPPRPGHDIVLTIDMRLQRLAEELLDRPLEPSAAAASPLQHARSGAIIVLDVQTGAVLVAAAAPRFDLNVAARPASPEAQELTARSDAPLFNRTVQMSLPPGSTFKPVVALAALKKGVNPREPFVCRGYLHDPDRFRCLIFRHHAVGHDVVNMTDAITRSCNVYFFHLAEQIGSEEIVRWGEAFGFGRCTGIDVAGEEPGNLPTRGRPTALRAGPVYEGEALGLAIGQGSLSATPLQVAVMMAAIANGGLRVVPHVRRDAFQPPRPVDGLVPGSDPSLVLVREALEKVVADPRGTGHQSVYLREVPIAGKTGTAQSGSPAGDHAWFAGYVPARKPQFAIAVVLEHAGSGGHAAGPLARELVKKMLQLGYVSPPATPVAGSTTETPAARR